MHPWQSIHFKPLETEDIFLVRGFKPFLAAHIWPHTGRRAFFIRYEDASGPHLRLRLRAEENLLPAFEQAMADRGAWTVQPFEPETERFGGTQGVALAEEHFHLSARVVLDRLARPMSTYGDYLFDTLRLHTITAAAAGMGYAEIGGYFDRLYQLWLPAFFQAPPGMSAEALEKALTSDFQQNFEGQKEDLAPALRALWNALDQKKFDTDQPEWQRWLLGNRMILEQFGTLTEKVLPSLLHLTANRMGVNNQDEVYLFYILSQSLGTESTP